MNKLVVGPGNTLKVGKQLRREGVEVTQEEAREAGITEKEFEGLLRDRKLVERQDPPVRPVRPRRDEGQAGTSPNPFGLDPDGLRGKSLGDLNLMLVARKAPRATTVEAAVAALSRDFIPPPPPPPEEDDGG